MALVLDFQEKYAKALALYQKVLDERKSHFPEEVEEILRIKLNIISILQKQG